MVGGNTAGEATPLEAEFVGNAMAADFLSRLKARIADLEEAIRDQESGKDTHLSALVGIEGALASGTAAARRLDAIVGNRLRDDAVAKAVWARTRRVGYRGPRGKNEPATPVTSPAPPPSSRSPETASGST